MSLLGALYSPSRFGAESGDAIAVLRIDPDSLDPATTPPALFVLIRQRGAVVWSADAVQALQARGFSIQSHDVSAAERAWMTARSPSYVKMGAPGLVWFAACPLGATVDAEGMPVCGAGFAASGVTEVASRPGAPACSTESIPETLLGVIKPGAITAAQRIAPNGATVCPRYFGGNPSVSGAQRASAQRTVAIYDQLTRSVAGVEAQRLRSGLSFGPGQATAVSNARAWLASISQPVEVFCSAFPGSANRVGRTRLSHGAQFGAVPIVAIVIVALCVATVAVAIACLSDDSVQKAGIEAQTLLNAALAPTIRELSACVADTSRTDAQRAACADSLKSLAPDLGVNPDAAPTDWGKVAKYGVIGLGVVATVYLVGPAIRAASTSTAAALQVGEQKDLQRRKMIAEVGR